MPEQPFFRVPRFYSLNNQVCSLILLIPADNFIFPIFFVRGKHGKKLKNIHDFLWCYHVCHIEHYIGQASLALIFRSMPGSPAACRHAYRAIPVTFSFCGKVKDIGDKHPRNTFFVCPNIIRSVQPGNGVSHRCFQLPHCYGKTIDQKHNVQPFAMISGGINPLVRYYVFILGQFLSGHRSKKTNRDHSTVLSKRK